MATTASDVAPLRAPSDVGQRARSSRAVAVWIFVCAAMVLAMVVVGGVTRLTRSGLSIVEWKPITGALPPIGAEAWQAEFAKYQASPEYRHVNAGMSLEGFQSIFLVEWFHRLLGRMVGVVTFVPLVWFAARKRLSRARLIQLGGLFVLGGLQGFLGWFMVKSGLVDVPRVSPYRLTAHLLMALTIFVGLLWAGLDELRETSARAPIAPRGRGASTGLIGALIALVVITITWGGFMAGLHAGHVAPSFPTMNGAWIPSDVFAMPLGALTPFEGAVHVHFLHRALAYVTAGLAIAVAVGALRNEREPVARGSAWALLAVVALQITLGALTVLQHVPVWLASWHQGNGALTLGVAVVLAWGVRAARRSSASAAPVELQ